MADSSNSVQEWSRNEIHRLIITPTSTQKKQELYAAWASEYDADVSEMGYEAPETSINILHSYIPLTSEKTRVLDAGCGTGRCGEHLRKIQTKSQDIHLIGLDYSHEMIQEAEKRQVYDELIQADLAKNVDVEKVGFLVATGVFLEGHCGPEVLPNVLRCLKVGGVAVVTVRNVSFRKRERDYLNWIEKGGGVVVENKVMTYMKGNVDANYVVIRKQREC